LCSMWLRSSDAGHTGSKDRGLYAAIDRVYGHMLHWSLKHRFVMLVVAVAVTVSVVFVYPRIGQELVPDDDQGEFNVSINLPRGTSLDRTMDYTKDVEDLVRKLPEVQTVFTSIQPGNANYFVGMTPLETRKLSQQELMRNTRAMLVRRFRGPGVRINVSGGTDLSGASSAGGNNQGGGGGNYSQGNRLQMSVQGSDIEVLQ